jgi:6-phosphogluconolactonase (cycloisomerase 2 family)
VQSNTASAQGTTLDSIIYTASNATTGNAVLAYQRKENGELRSIGSFPTSGFGTGAGLGSQGSVVLSQDQRWLYVVNAGSNDITVFAVEGNNLSKASKVASGGNDPISIAVDDDLIYVLNAKSDLIAGFRQLESGQLKAIPGSARALGATSTNPAQISFSPNGESLIITEKATNAIAIFGVSRAGFADNTPKVEPSAGPTPFGFSFSKQHTLLVTEAAGGAANASSVSSYHLGRDGGFRLVEGSVPTKQTAACWISVTPDGRYAYSSNTGSQSVTGFSVSRAGELTALTTNGISASTGANAIDSVISADGRFLYVLTNGTQDTIAVFKIEWDGSLQPFKSLPGLPASAVGLAIR